MFVVACAAPTCTLEPAPITSLSLSPFVGNAEVAAFWGLDDGYYLRATSQLEDGGPERWYQIEGDKNDFQSSLEERVAMGELMASITPIGGGRVAFPTGSSGRRVYRVWRTGSAAQGAKTRILEVRAARSRRRPA